MMRHRARPANLRTSLREPRSRHLRGIIPKASAGEVRCCRAKTASRARSRPTGFGHAARWPSATRSQYQRGMSAAERDARFGEIRITCERARNGTRVGLRRRLAARFWTLESCWITALDPEPCSVSHHAGSSASASPCSSSCTTGTGMTRVRCARRARVTRVDADRAHRAAAPDDTGPDSGSTRRSLDRHHRDALGRRVRGVHDLLTDCCGCRRRRPPSGSSARSSHRAAGLHGRDYRPRGACLRAGRHVPDYLDAPWRGRTAALDHPPGVRCVGLGGVPARDGAERAVDPRNHAHDRGSIVRAANDTGTRHDCAHRRCRGRRAARGAGPPRVVAGGLLGRTGAADDGVVFRLIEAAVRQRQFS